MVLTLVIGDLHMPHRAVDLPPKFKLLLTPGKIKQVLCTGNLSYASGGYEFLKSIAPDVRIVRSPMDEVSNMVILGTEPLMLDAGGLPDLAGFPPPVAFGRPPEKKLPSRPTSAASANWPSGIGGVRGPANPLNWPASISVAHGSMRIGMCSSYARFPAVPISQTGDDRDLVEQFVNSNGADVSSQLGSLLMLQSIEQLSIIARKLDVDILITGGYGHHFAVLEWGGRLFINPGSATGAFDFSNFSTIRGLLESQNQKKIHEMQGKNTPFESFYNHVIPTFVLMDVQDSHVILYIYKLIDGEVKVEKMDFTKKIYD